ncbi:hypothetical protein F5888DRAFT_1065477 [Russula emetica]|nr:hypothetical protein F5888DRAFT_1065477 [Russula emetica]
MRGESQGSLTLPARPPNMLSLRCAFLLFFLSTFVSSNSKALAIDHGVLQCTTKAFTSAWSETFNKFMGLTPNYTPGTFIAVDCTELPNMRCNAIPENAKWYVQLHSKTRFA